VRALSVFEINPVTVDAKLSSSLIAAASSFNVLRSPGAPSTKLLTAVETNAVVAIWVVFVDGSAVGAVGVPVNAGDVNDLEVNVWFPSRVTNAGIYNSMNICLITIMII